MTQKKMYNEITSFLRNINYQLATKPPNNIGDYTDGWKHAVDYFEDYIKANYMPKETILVKIFKTKTKRRKEMEKLFTE